MSDNIHFYTAYHLLLSIIKQRTDLIETFTTQIENAQAEISRIIELYVQANCVNCAYHDIGNNINGNHRHACKHPHFIEKSNQKYYSQPIIHKWVDIAQQFHLFLQKKQNTCKYLEKDQKTPILL